MTKYSQSPPFTEVCRRLAELTAQAAEHVRYQAASGDMPLPIVGEFFEDLANVHLNIAQVVSTLDRRR